MDMDTKKIETEQLVELCGYQILPQEVSHIEKHKYFMSLEASRDVGLEAAVSDWFIRIREDFAVWFNSQDISEQMIALNLHLARLKKQNIVFEEAEEIRRFAKNWRMEHPRIPLDNCCFSNKSEKACCQITFFNDGDTSGTEIEKAVCLEAGIHIRPSVHLYSILRDRYDVRIFINNRNIDSVAKYYPQFIHRFNGKCYFDTSCASVMEFLEVSAIPSGETLYFFIESCNDSIIREVCRDLAFLDSARFCD